MTRKRGVKRDNGGLGKACQRGGTSGSEWSCAVNRSRALVVLGRGGEDERQDGIPRRFKARLDVEVAAREGEMGWRKWTRLGVGRPGGGANGRRKIELLVESVVRTGCARILCV